MPAFPSPSLFPSSALYPDSGSQAQPGQLPASLDRPHVQFPFRRDPTTGRVVVVEQDTIAHIQSCEATITVCPAGFRADRPDFGWRQPEMSLGPIDPTALVDALNRLEPRVVSRVASAYIDLADPSKWTIEVDSSMDVQS